MKIVCATNMPFVEEAFRTLGEPVVIEGRRIGPADVRDAELLAIRSTTRVDAALLDGSRVRFVGTATIGTDHLDTEYLDRRGIRWCYAPGCNANSVAEYITCALLCLAVRHGFTLEGRTLGIVGVGHVGRRVASQAAALGLRVLLNDPPRERAEGRSSGPFVPLEEVLAESDVVTLHVPLTREGGDATWHMADARFFARLRRGAVLINAARGAVVHTDALVEALRHGRVAHAVIDTWEGEPAYRKDLLARVALGTPHIAGYSFEGKVAGTERVYREACRFLGRTPGWSPEPAGIAARKMQVDLEVAGLREEEALWALTRRVYDIEADDRCLREASAEDGWDHFDRLRRQYPVRCEFATTSASLRGAVSRVADKARRIGFPDVLWHGNCVLHPSVHEEG